MRSVATTRTRNDSRAANEAGPWFTPPAGGEAALRLYCLPYAGGSASTYLDWPATVTGKAGVAEICAVQLPGRGARLTEPPLHDAGRVATEVAAAISANTDGPFALFGHSMGALLAYEIAQQLRRSGAPEPVALLVSGRRPPEYPEPYPDIRHLSDADLVLELDRRYGRLAATLSNADLRAAFVPAIRADFTICETYRPSSSEPLRHPIFAYGGTSDSDVTPDQLAGWRTYTTESFTMNTLPGNHFFLERRSDIFLRVLVRDLRRLPV